MTTIKELIAYVDYNDYAEIPRIDDKSFPYKSVDAAYEALKNNNEKNTTHTISIIDSSISIDFNGETFFSTIILEKLKYENVKIINPDNTNETILLIIDKGIKNTPTITFNNVILYINMDIMLQPTEKDKWNPIIDKTSIINCSGNCKFGSINYSMSIYETKNDKNWHKSLYEPRVIFTIDPSCIFICNYMWTVDLYRIFYVFNIYGKAIIINPENYNSIHTALIKYNYNASCTVTALINLSETKGNIITPLLNYQKEFIIDKFDKTLIKGTNLTWIDCINNVSTILTFGCNDKYSNYNYNNDTDLSSNDAVVSSNDAVVSSNDAVVSIDDAVVSIDDAVVSIDDAVVSIDDTTSKSITVNSLDPLFIKDKMFEKINELPITIVYSSQAENIGLVKSDNINIENTIPSIDMNGIYLEITNNTPSDVKFYLTNTQADITDTYIKNGQISTPLDMFVGDINKLYYDCNTNNGTKYHTGALYHKPTIINNDFSHTMFDGTIFLVNANDNNIQITIPYNISERHIRYKRIDTSKNCVNVLYEGGIDGYGKCYKLKSNVCNHGDTNKLYTSLKLYIYDGKAYIL